jgi:hypothetical protein
MAAAKPIKLPKTMGTCADLLYKTREERLAAQKVVDDLQKQESAIREHIINNLPKSDTGASGKLARVTVVIKQVPQVKDWDKFYAHVKKTGQFELMQRRVSDGAVRERWDNGKQIPGVEPFGVVSVSINKV